MGYTYFDDTVGQKSFIDHFFIQRDLLPYIGLVNILEDGTVLLDQFPIVLNLIITHKTRERSVQSSSLSKRSHEFCWDKGDIAMIPTKPD